MRKNIWKSLSYESEFCPPKKISARTDGVKYELEIVQQHYPKGNGAAFFIECSVKVQS